MATGGGASQFSPFNLFLKESVSWPAIRGNRVKAMEVWNNLEDEDKHEYYVRSEQIKESLKIASYEGEDAASQLKTKCKGPFKSLQILKDVFGAEELSSEALCQRLKLICVQYSAHHHVSGGVESRYYPNEVSVVHFSLAGGVRREESFFLQIPHEDIPAYCKGEMKERYEMHFIPFEEEEFLKVRPVAPSAGSVLLKLFGDDDEVRWKKCEFA